MVVEILTVAVDVTVTTLSPVSVDDIEIIFVGRKTSEHRDE